MKTKSANFKGVGWCVTECQAIGTRLNEKF